jgi:hypothetical protein
MQQPSRLSYGIRFSIARLCLHSMNMSPVWVETQICGRSAHNAHFHWSLCSPHGSRMSPLRSLQRYVITGSNPRARSAPNARIPSHCNSQPNGRRDANVEMKLHKSTLGHHRLDEIARSTLRLNHQLPFVQLIPANGKTGLLLPVSLKGVTLIWTGWGSR